MSFKIPTKEEQEQILRKKVELHIYPLIKELTNPEIGVIPLVVDINEYHERRKKATQELTEQITSDILERVRNSRNQ